MIRYDFMVKMSIILVAISWVIVMVALFSISQDISIVKERCGYSDDYVDNTCESIRCVRDTYMFDREIYDEWDFWLQICYQD